MLSCSDLDVGSGRGFGAADQLGGYLDQPAALVAGGGEDRFVRGLPVGAGGMRGAVGVTSRGVDQRVGVAGGTMIEPQW